MTRSKDTIFEHLVKSPDLSVHPAAALMTYYGDNMFQCTIITIQIHFPLMAHWSSPLLPLLPSPQAVVTTPRPGLAPLVPCLTSLCPRPQLCLPPSRLFHLDTHRLDPGQRHQQAHLQELVTPGLSEDPGLPAITIIRSNCH